MAVPAFRIFRRLGFRAVSLLFVSFGSTALAEDQMVAQMACQQRSFDGSLPRAMIFTQAEINPAFTNAVAPVTQEKEDFKEIPFKLQIYPLEVDLDLEGDVASQVKELRATTDPEPEFDFISIGRKDDNWLGFHEVNETVDYLIRINLKPDFPNVNFARPGKESFAFRCKRFYLTEYEGE